MDLRARNRRTGNLKKNPVVLELRGFGAVWICRSKPTFRRYMLSPSSGAEVTRQRSRELIDNVKNKG
jgi:hypothetical protein